MLNIFSLVKKGLSLRMNFKYLVCWRNLLYLERKDENECWLEKDSLSGSSWVALSVSAPLSKATEVTGNTPLHTYVCGV